MKKLRISILIVILSLAFLATGCSGGSGSATSTSTTTKNGKTIYKWKLVHEEYEGDMQDVYCKEFADLLYKKSNGQIQLEIYSVGQIGDALQQCELLQNGAVEFAIVSPGNTGTVVPENQLFSLHFLFPEDMNKTQEVLKNSVALNKMLRDKYLEKNILPLSFWTEGAMEWTSNVELRTPDAFKGLKFRTMQSPMIIAAYKAYGANPTPMSYTEVYSGLQLNMIEGEENPISAINTSKFYEVQKYLTEANSNLYITATCVNPDFYNSLPNNLKKIIDESIEEMIPRSFEIQEEQNDAALKEIEKKSDIIVETLTPEEREAFKKKALTAYQTYKNLVGKDGAEILDKLMEEINTIEAE
ncbi:MAG: DctP family TRAP transporter solute-binding subunit [Eubacteriales bacterium]|nr:DctP family TRAP transporter solute-binding subunit [Eubacteriales bacterium]